MLIVLGCLSFLIMLMNDLNQIWMHWKIGKVFFVIGCLLLGTATILLIKKSLPLSNVTMLSWIAAILCLVCFLLLIYTLFFALPFGDTYVDQNELKVYDQGMYALCRHPGILWFFFCYLFLAVSISSFETGIAAILFSFMNLCYALIQDILIFPRTLKGYGDYQRNVPFLIPTMASIKNSLRK